MNLTGVFIKAFEDMKKKAWDRVYVMIDLHGTIVKPVYREEERYEFYPFALEALRLMTNEPKISLILWTSTYIEKIEKYLEVLRAEGVRFDQVNANLLEKSTDIQCFDKKPYFNVGIDDKFGFDPENDWEGLYRFLAEDAPNWLL